MSVDSPAAVNSPAELLQRVWVECFRSVLSEVAGFSVVVEPEAQGEVPAGAEGQPGVWMRFAASKKLNGEMAILATEAAALPLAKMLLSEPLDSGAPFDAGFRDAYEELLRQVAGRVASELKGVAGGDVEIKPSGSEVPAWPTAIKTGIRISAEKLPGIQITLVATMDLAASIIALHEPKAVAANDPSPSQAPRAEKSVTTNLELLLDVSLNATIRFGQRQMLLRDILELHPGVAIALDRRVEESVELLVGGRIVAKGEVVIVDGNYGLRITEIVSTQERIEFLAR